MFGDIGKIMKLLGQMKTKLPQMQEELGQAQYSAQAGGGLVSVTVSGKQELTDLKIDPELLRETDAEMLEDLIKAAVSTAQQEAAAAAAEAMKQLTGGMNIPSMGGLMP